MSDTREYVEPTLIEYGDIGELTEKTGKRKFDGNQGSNRNV
mgnify:CR=1 FL=1